MRVTASIRFKTLRVMLLSMIVLLVGFSYYALTYLSEEFHSIEDRRIGDNLERILDTQKFNLDNLSIKLTGWAAWDDTYEFTEDKNQEYIDSNLTPFAVQNLRVNFMVFMNNKSEIVTSLGYDYNNSREVDLPEGLRALIYPGSEIITHSEVSGEKKGILSLEEGPLMFVSRPIITSDGEGPIKGTLIFARFLDQRELELLSGVVHFPLQLIKIDDKLGDEYKEAFQVLNRGEKYHVHNADRKTSHGYALVKDYFGKPAFLLRMSYPRDITQQGVRSINIFIASFVIASIGYLVLIIFFVNRFLIKRVEVLSREVVKIGESGSMKLRINVDPSRDEIASLGTSINNMLEFLQIAQREVSEKKKELEGKVGQIQKQNESLTETKKAMLNLLEDEKGLEQALKSERDRIGLIISSMGEGLLVVDNEKRIIMLNPVAENLLETKGQVVIGKSWSEVVKTLKEDKEVPVMERSFTQVVAKRKPIITNLEDDHYYLTKSGRKFPIVSITAPLISGGKLVGAVKVFRDATVDKDAKENIEKEVTERTKELAEEKARLLASIESLPRGFILTDPGGNVILTNKLLVDIFGKIPREGWTLASLQTVLGKSFDLMGNFKKVISQVEKSVYVGALSWGTKFLELFIVPVTLANGSVVGTIILIGDVTEAKVLERSKDEFFSIASHELRTPLTAIRGNTALIKDYFVKKVKDPEFVNIVDDIHTSSIRLIGIVNDFLNLSRLEQGRMEFKKEKVDVAAAIKQVFEELGESASAKSLKLVYIESKTKVPLALADNEKVKEVLVNILGNAINYTEKGDVTVSLTAEGGQLKVKVADTGRGILVANQNLLFRKFQQAGSSLYTRDTTKGTGLGLYISKLMVEGMEGTIGLLVSKVGEGSTFCFTLPIAKS
ncbi:hypothetical protein A2129_01785 [Candidatus Woesebacteria bacterium GWC1_42_13]|uniref:histidine kinase n=2 Tax=Candidatus Woeseibacteriota TaxID=1752722 RepID=A0A1F7WYQ2_9BACT|nr:MAG: hypothetical protein A2112_02160 [Candidatus Woesebacteria bacterium GWA1_42_12]OGM07827.1 MAG: hypothetical protein A2129_01785 [Candidatus Woesebacteria bacterium GWC1_42_13]